ncbi:MAG TPA: acyl-CoA dehydrogenase family protein [Deltaproteobacteria bacterium]|nr:acyl-CoA dehydrogenase family protein [Deltaproteobacteria bacterium]HPP80268.1 acyl-CoA dehydrogenase family protein [Deltaproteobacteria bacterium]
MARDLDRLFMVARSQTGQVGAEVTDLLRQWVNREVVSVRMEYRKEYGKLFEQRWRSLATDLSIARLTMSESRGGFGWNKAGDAAGLARAAWEIGRADVSLGLLAAGTWIVHLLGGDTPCLEASPVSGGAEGAPKASFVLPGPGMSGESDPLFSGRAVRARAVRTKTGYELSGRLLRPLWAGAVADVHVIVCALDDEPCIAFVRAGAEGLARGPALSTTGLNACTNADLTLERVPVGSGDILVGADKVRMLFSWIHLLASGVCAGAAADFFDLLADWADSRTIKGGVPLKDNPLCASVLAESAQEIALARILVHDLADVVASAGAPEEGSAERAFVYACTIGRRILAGLIHALNRGMELMGSAGYAKEWYVEKHWRDIKNVQSSLSGVGAGVPEAMDAARFFYGSSPR